MTQKLKQKIEKWLTIGAVTPSSKFLINKMLDKIDFNSDITILQLGYGRGGFAKEIMKKFSPGSRLVIFEIDENCRKHQLNDKRVRYIEDSAEKISAYCYDMKFDYIISTLPFTTLPKRVTRKVQQEIKDHLKENGKFLQSQYSLHSRGDITRLFATKPKIQFTVRNFPPAFIYEAKNTVHDYLN